MRNKKEESPYSQKIQELIKKTNELAPLVQQKLDQLSKTTPL